MSLIIKFTVDPINATISCFVPMLTNESASRESAGIEFKGLLFVKAVFYRYGYALYGMLGDYIHTSGVRNTDN